MDTRALLDQLLAAASQMAGEGRDYAERSLGVPAQGTERDAMLSGLGKGALAGGLMSLLLGTRAGRTLGGSAVQLGGLAALGSLAWKAYQNWDASRVSGSAPAPAGIAAPPAGIAEQHALVLLRAMIAAAKADGHIDDTERARIDASLDQLGLDSSLADRMRDELDGPLDPRAIAAGAGSGNPQAAAEIYLVSRLVIDPDHFMERAYLEELAKELALAPELVAQLDAQARELSSGA